MNFFKAVYCRTFQLCFRAALPLLPYREPKILNSMGEIAGVLKNSGVSRALVVTDSGIVTSGLYGELEDALKSGGISVFVYSRTVPNPTIDNVEEARRIYLDNDCGAIVSLGGGSAIDCAKAVGARIARPKKDVSKMRGLLKVLRKTPLALAVPTTAGTGSETTLAAVITDTNTKHKYPINDFCLIPDYAVLDYRTTLGLPRQLTATTGMDALTHAVEAFIGNSTNAYTRKMALEATELIGKYLYRAYCDANDVEARREMMRAAYCAGNAFTRSYVGYVHGIAHSLGGMYSVPHGFANAVILPYVLEEYGKSAHKKLYVLAERLGLCADGCSESEGAQRFIGYVRQMNKKMGIPERIECIKEEDIPLLAGYADKECNPLYPVPKLMNAKELEKLYYTVKNGGNARD